MTELDTLRALLRNAALEWQGLRLSELQFWHRGEARLALVSLLAAALVLLIARSLVTNRPGRHRLVLPAVVRAVRPSRLALLRHAPLALFLAGVPFFVLALGDPFTALTTRQISHPGRRIALLIDASTSMRTPFKAGSLNKRYETDSAFFTAVGAAEKFLQMRIDGKYKDLLALIEFGSESYVVTPFTSDYDNVLLSTSLIGDPAEFSAFPDQGTLIAEAVEQTIGLFKAFDFLDASGNLLIIFSDGEDVHVASKDRTVDDIVKSALDNKVPVYVIRTNYDKAKGKVVSDDLWEAAVAKTGGRFYAAVDEDTILKAVREINEVSAGTIELKQYSAQQGRFGPFALIAGLLWTTAAALKLLPSYFQSIP